MGVCGVYAGHSNGERTSRDNTRGGVDGDLYGHDGRRGERGTWASGAGEVRGQINAVERLGWGRTWAD